MDYLIMVSGFSMWMIYHNKHNIFSFGTLCSAFALGLITATRSFIVVFAILLMVNSTLILLISRSSKKLIISLVFVSIAAIAYVYAERMEMFRPMFARSQDSIYLIRLGQIELASNRTWSEATPIVVEKAGVWGHGAFLSGYFYDHIMVPHCLYLDMYSKFGLLGIVALSFLFLEMLKMSYRIGNSEFIFFSTVIALAVQQSKISAFRTVSSMLMYTFLFTAVYVLNTRSRDGEMSFQTSSGIRHND
ncbi:hypothetical protein ACFL0Q_05060 [Thermodesulfobacteriota bacterium]